MNGIYALALKYKDKGFYPVPMGKSPRTIKDAKKAFINDWQSIDDFSPDVWAQATGLGIHLRRSAGVVALDRDSKDPVIKAAIADALPPSYCERIGDKEKDPTIFFQIDDRAILPGRKELYAIGIEFLTEGHYCGIHLFWQGNDYYSFPKKHLLKIDKDDLPLLSQKIIDDLREINKNIITLPNITAVSTLFGEKERGRCRHNSHNSISTIMMAMIHRGESIELIKNELLSEDEKNNADSDYFYFNCPSRKWKSDNRETNCEWLINDALKRNKIEVIEPARIEKKLEYSKPLIPPDGFGGEVFKYILKNSRIPREQFSFASTISLFSVLIGNKFHFKGTFANTFSLMIAPSGQGKNDPLKAPAKLLHNAGMENLIGYEDYGSATAIYNELPKYPVRLDCIDEASELFSAFNDSNYNNKSKAEVLTKLFSTGGHLFAGKNNKTSGKEGRCFSPFLSVLMATTPEGFKAFTEKHFRKGLGNRILFFFETEKREKKYHFGYKSLSLEIQDELEKMSFPAIINRESDIKELKYSSDIDRILPSYYSALDKSTQGLELEEMETRKAEYFNKLIMIHHAMSKGSDYFMQSIDKSSLDWALENVMIIWDNLAINLGNNLEIDMDHLNIKEKFKAYLSKKDGVSLATFHSHFRKIYPTLRKMALDDCLQTGEIITKNRLLYPESYNENT